MAKVLLPYGASFANLWPSTNKQSAVNKSVAFSRGGEGVCVEVSLLMLLSNKAAKRRQKRRKKVIHEPVLLLS
jgi:hypothetical protein